MEHANSYSHAQSSSGMAERDERFFLWPGVKDEDDLTRDAGARAGGGTRWARFGEKSRLCSSSEEESDEPYMNSSARRLAMSSMGSPYGSEISLALV